MIEDSQTNKNRVSSEYEGPNLLRNVDDIIAEAHSKGYYDGDSLDIYKVIGEHSSIKIEVKDMEGIMSGSLEYVNGCWIMSVNKKHNPKRQKFTLAHEFGCYILHSGILYHLKKPLFFREPSMASIDDAANEFASCLLMPESSVRKKIDEDGVKNIGELADFFEVPASAMKDRVVQLGYNLI